MRLRDLRTALIAAYRSAYEQRHPTRLFPYLETAVAVALLGALLSLLSLGAGMAPPTSPYLLLILALSLRWGLRVGLAASLLSVEVERLQAARAEVPYALDSLIVFASTALAVGLLASFYRGQRLRAERAAEQERSAAEYQRRMVGILAHDLKAPLTAVRGYTELALRASRQEAPRAANSLTIALQQLDRVTTMITSLVEASRIEQAALALRPIALAPVLQRAVAAVVAPRHPVSIAWHVAPDAGVLADAGALERILDNLLANAVKYSPQGGAIVLDVRAFDAPGGERLRLQVIDHGLGVPAEERGRIFAPYYRGTNQDQAPGTGLGLYVCRELAQKLGGALSYEPNPAGGSIFALELAALRAADASGGLIAAGPAHEAPSAFTPPASDLVASGPGSTEH